MEITKDQAKLFLELLNVTDTLPKEDNMMKQLFGNIEVGLFDTFILRNKLQEFVGE